MDLSVQLSLLSQTKVLAKLDLTHSVRWGPSSPKRGTAAHPPLLGPCTVAKWLDGSRCHLVRRQASVQATLCQMGTQLPSPKSGTAAPTFRPMSVMAKQWMDLGATRYGSRPRPGPHCVRWGPSSSRTERGTAASPTFTVYGRRLCLHLCKPQPVSIVAKRLDGSGQHLVQRQASVQATLCYMVSHLPSHGKEHSSPPISLAHA